jgi:hypothetical protein
VVIYMDNCRKAKVARLMRLARVAKLHGRRQDEELLCVNWNPAFGSIAMSFYQTPQELSPQMPDVNDEFPPALMDRIYALASQI